MKKSVLFLLWSVSLVFSTINCSNKPIEPFLRETVVFKSGDDGYHTFRIPSLITTKKGTALAICEGRKGSRSDTGNIDIVIKRSSDNGATWSAMEVIWDDGENVCGNPCPVIDRDTGTIWLLLTHNLGIDSEREIMTGESEGTRTVWVMKSADDGVSWSKPVEITQTTKRPEWTWYATGPGVGIQLKSGRLIIPCDYADRDSGEWGSHVIYSDDHGVSWKIGGVLFPKCNECQVVERADGSVLINMRSYHGKNRRAIATSTDGGITWSDISHDETLVEPVCQASLLRYTFEKHHGKNRVVFSNPADTKRIKMTVRLSYDECITWPVSKLLYEGPSAYSCLTFLPNYTIGCLYEKGQENAYETLTFAHFNLEWLSDGEDAVK
ncbi:MAG: exo-alpha-sialidase [Candidatus Latescibacteria bacterium]|nr:exo-alpha-sialidase [Candidatus Latescibacterota bacterium]